MFLPGDYKFKHSFVLFNYNQVTLITKHDFDFTFIQRLKCQTVCELSVGVAV